MKVPIMKVNRQVAMNPVTKAVARERLKNAVRDQKIALYLLTQGEECSLLLAGVAGTLNVVLSAAYMDRLQSPDVSILKGGLNACFQVMLTNSYDTLQTTAIVQGLDKALLLAPKLKAESINYAWTRMLP